MTTTHDEEFYDERLRWPWRLFRRWIPRSDAVYKEYRGWQWYVWKPGLAWIELEHSKVEALANMNKIPATTFDAAPPDGGRADGAEGEGAGE